MKILIALNSKITISWDPPTRRVIHMRYEARMRGMLTAITLCNIERVTSLNSFNIPSHIDLLYIDTRLKVKSFGLSKSQMRILARCFAA